MTRLESIIGAFRALFAEGPGAVAVASAWALRRRLNGGDVADRPAEPSSPQPRGMSMHEWHLEAPDITQSPADPERFEMRGWIASVQPVTHIALADERCARLLPITRHERPDVTEQYGLSAIGFSASCRYEDVRDMGVVRLVFETAQGDAGEILVPTYRPSREMRELKAAKLARIRDALQCPVCGYRTLNRRPESLQCRRCRAGFPRSESRLDFLTPEFRSRFNIVPTINVSSMGYDGEAMNIIHRLRDGLILDCGAGSRDRYFGNVVNYEIVAYDSTDVLGVGERLPFRDAAFDAVFSFAVLEHVKDPFACAREILRVLKPGGTLYCQVPFLQPVHGFPHHYHNSTLMGMRNLFGDAIRPERAGAFLFGQPVFALTWILNRYAEGLPPDRRAEFKAMKVEDLMQHASRYLGSPFVTQLSSESREELACCNALVATKVDER